MVTAKLNTENFRALKREDSLNVWDKSLQSTVILLHRLWWHTKGYGTIFGMIVLVLFTMTFLSLRSFGNMFIKFRFQEEVERSGKNWLN